MAPTPFCERRRFLPPLSICEGLSSTRPARRGRGGAAILAGQSPLRGAASLRRATVVGAVGQRAPGRWRCSTGLAAGRRGEAAAGRRRHGEVRRRRGDDRGAAVRGRRREG